MIKTFQSHTGFLAVIQPVLNFEFRSLGFIWDLEFGVWNFHGPITRTISLIPDNYRLN